MDEEDTRVALAVVMAKLHCYYCEECSKFYPITKMFVVILGSAPKAMCGRCADRKRVSIRRKVRFPYLDVIPLEAMD